MASGLQNSILIDLCLPFPETPDDVCLECYLFDRSQCARSQTGLEGQPCHCQSVQLSSFQNSANSKPDTICLPGSLCETDGTVWAACATANNEDDCAAMPQCNLRRAVEFPAVSMLCFDDDLWESKLGSISSSADDFDINFWCSGSCYAGYGRFFAQNQLDKDLSSIFCNFVQMDNNIIIYYKNNVDASMVDATPNHEKSKLG